MKCTVRFTKKALNDFEFIVEHYSELNKKTAKRYHDQIIASTKKIASFPEVGRWVPEFESEFEVAAFDLRGMDEAEGHDFTKITTLQ